MMSPENQEVVIFDMYQTLVDIDVSDNAERTKKAFQEVFVSYVSGRGIEDLEAARFQTYYDQEIGAFYKAHDKEKEHHNIATIFADTLTKHYGLSIDNDELANMVYEFRKINRGYVRLYPGVQDMLKALSAEYRLILASYTQGIYSERELIELGIREFFTDCVFSSYLGFKKKSDAFYKKCLEVAGTSPNNCVMVGDSLIEDVSMAQKNGMHTVWVINPLSKDKETPGVVPDASVLLENIITLPSVIKEIL